MGWFSIGNWYILLKGIHWGGGGHSHMKGVWEVLRSWSPGFFQAIRRSLAYQFTVNAPLLCLPFSCFRKFSHFQPWFGQNSISLDPNFSRKIRSLNPTFWNPRGTHPPEKSWVPSPDGIGLLRDRSQTLVRGGGWCKEYLSRKFFAPPFQTAKGKKIRAPPFLPWKLRVNAVEKHINSILNGKSVVIFSGPSLTRVKIFKGPPFCIRPPLQVFVNGP